MLVFDTDTEVMEHLKKNIELLNKVCSNVEVLTVAQVLKYADVVIVTGLLSSSCRLEYLYI